MIPERTFVGSQTQGYVTVLTLFMRPIFIIVGFWMAEIIIGPALVTLTDMFFSYQGAMSILEEVKVKIPTSLIYREEN
jgi:hypothetical protein